MAQMEPEGRRAALLLMRLAGRSCVADYRGAAFIKVTALMKIADADVIRLTNALSVSRNIERMADHASKIPQEVIYLVIGELVKHKDYHDNLL